MLYFFIEYNNNYCLAGLGYYNELGLIWPDKQEYLEVLLNIDESIFSLINHGMSSSLSDFIFIPLRHKLFWIPVYIFLICFIFLNFEKDRWIIFLCLAACISVSDVSSSRVIKNNIQRLRPCHIEELGAIVRVPCSNGYSFTSSHATNHFAISTFLIMLFSFWKYRWLFLFWASLIALAQVYVGIHYPFDVIAGAILGSFIGWIMFQVYIKFRINKIDK